MSLQLPHFIIKKNNSLWLTEDERDNLKISYRIKEIVFSGQSSFQHVMILDSYDFGRMLVLDGIVQTTSLDGYIYNEMITHIPLCIHPSPRKVLIIGGGDCGAAKEVCKYSSVEHIDMVEIDQLVVDVCREHLPEVSGNLSDPRVHFIFENGVTYVQNRENEYDIVIVDSSDPIGPAKVLFEKSFYQNLYKILKSDGLMVCQSQSPIFHAEIMKQTFIRISQIFPLSNIYTAVVPTYPGGLWSFTIGSKQYIDPDPSRLVYKDTRYINPKVLENCFSIPQFMEQQLKSD
ncbi:MAG: polyamine aminopropyltransferase [Peptococcaceae bacterium]|nr:polyamine aminopropyltransferase [Peptococcaceae bacterium]